MVCQGVTEKNKKIKNWAISPANAPHTHKSALVRLLSRQEFSHSNSLLAGSLAFLGSNFWAAPESSDWKNERAETN